jgi:putative ATP-binding cassette transporter
MLERCSEISGGAPLDLQADWSQMLSLGEQQRLSFARMLLANPAIALLDECTSALDLQNEKRLYSLLKERGIACVSVGHRASLKDYHDSILQLEASSDGLGASWEMKPCSEVASVA